MNTHTLLLFSATVLPLVCTPGPDILFIASQAMSAGTPAGLRATTGVLLGYGVHSFLVALGLAAAVAASPMLFEAIRWAGITYLVYLASKMIRAALRPGDLVVPKGMMVYVAILPQFMDRHAGSATVQAVVLSAVFMFWCAVVYASLCFALGRVGRRRLSDRKRRLIDGSAGGMVLVAAGFMALVRQ
jgi:threonine/homoserine/homoserine lactone efflux protein